MNNVAFKNFDRDLKIDINLKYVFGDTLKINLILKYFNIFLLHVYIW